MTRTCRSSVAEVDAASEVDLAELCGRYAEIY